ncbi:TetR/AcrR family transcriptional regulator [Qipengyuania aquimaris]|uniref:TetR/AcrR family transcriptional regulator n=1 Tax=Qipengyuania aquimaris TaxID=255984 RepID=UPI001CD40C64|nr:TetR/AcrR family transcriptional regulator [Qipengyuania aquimaris]MCA0903029.1 TetR/AcrR family transcriptional regulator [Qipengyuania aquimaris]
MKRSRILQAGAEALAVGGIADLDLNQIAATVDLKPSSLRYYFKNREALAEAIYLERLEEVGEGFDRVRDSRTLQQAVEALCRIEIDHWAQENEGQSSRKPQFGEVRTLSKERRSRVGARFEQVLRQASELFASHDVEIPDEMPFLPAQILLENLFWIPAWIDHFSEWEFPKAASDLARVLCDGIAQEGASFEWERIEDAESDPGSDIGRVDGFLRTATQLVCERGYRGTSIDEIAARLGLTKGSFYHHNSEKIALVQQCFEESYARVSQLQREASVRFCEPLDRIATVVGSIISIQMRQQMPIIRSSALPGLPRDLRMSIIGKAAPLDRWFVAELVAAHRRGQATDVDPFIAAQYLSVGANSSYDLARLYRCEPNERNITLVMERLFRGFAI